MPTIKPIKPFQKSQLQPPNNQFPLKPPVQKSSGLSSQEEVDKIFSSGPYSVHLPASNDELKKKNQLFKQPPQPPQPPQQGRGPKKRWIQKDEQEEEQEDMEVDNKEEEEEEEQEQESDISDTEIQLAKILNTFAKGKKKQDTLSASEMEEIDQAVPYGTEVRMRRMAQENIRIISSRMVRYLLCHEFQVRGSRGNTYTVQIGPKLDCTCRDHKVRGTHCKHILYVLMKELKVGDIKNNKIYHNLYPDDNILEDVFKKYHPSA